MPQEPEHQIAALIENVEWLIETRESPERWAKRLGMSPSAIEIALRRAGRSDLGQPIRAFLHRQRVAA